MKLNDKFKKINYALYEVLSRHNHSVISRYDLVIEINKAIQGNIRVNHRSLHHFFKMIDGYNIKSKNGKIAINTEFSFKCLCGCGGYTKGGYYISGHNRYHKNKKTVIPKGNLLGSNIMVD